jgi:pimeloyl-[acyl-carrier protein] synthase
MTLSINTTTNETLSLSNLASEEVRANPYPFYAQLRTQDPVHWDEAMGFWVLTRYADNAAVYNDARFSRAEGLMRGYERIPESDQKIAEPVYCSFSKTMFYSDPPYHTRLRGLVNKAFTPRAVEQMRPHIQRITDELLDGVQGGKSMDIIHDLAYPLPILVITEMLGLPAEDRWRFKEWSDDLFAILGTVRRHTPEMLQRAALSLTKLTDYVTVLSQARRREPLNDLLSALVAVVEEGERLSQEELAANVNIILSAGHETTSNLIGNGLLALLQHPEQMAKLREQPELVGSAVEEMMRYDNPVQIAYRSAAEDVDLGDKHINKGQLVNMVLGAANRDPERYSEPDCFNITRNEGRHLGLGLGIHFCLGAPLLRLEAEIVFNTLLRRFPTVQLMTENLDWQEHPIFRGVKSLPVLF